MEIKSNRLESISVRFSEKELDLCYFVAGKLGIPLSTYARQLILKEIRNIYNNSLKSNTGVYKA